ncbi:hypothetical protein [Roseomonas chloroacetimidivorans]|uniref:hypothetical protein n=1 Tax=Roseomonas chloroacetimidivorans TaxID=1766656 RepID=UPI003C74D8B4
MIEPTGDWTEDWGETWTLTIPGQPGRPDLLLRVFPDPPHTSEPWTWEVVALDDEAEREIEVGGSASRDAAMAAAVARATTYELE